VAAHTYARGAELGCPNCIAGEPQCCPFLWADEQPEPHRSATLKHMRYHLADVIQEVRRQ
jgi:hypothetical protein